MDHLDFGGTQNPQHPPRHSGNMLDGRKELPGPRPWGEERKRSNHVGFPKFTCKRCLPAVWGNFPGFFPRKTFVCVCEPTVLYLFLAVLSLCFYSSLSRVEARGNYSLAAVQCRLIIVMASLVAEHRLLSSSSVAAGSWA